MDLFIVALEIAADAHSGQKDKGENAYINHPLKVASMLDSEEEKVVALLHDVIEDSAYTLEDLREVGIPKHLLEAIDLLTKKEGVSYDDYLKGVKGNKLARVVKIADLFHNSDLKRLKRVTQKDLDRQAKYRKAIIYLASNNTNE